MGTDTNPTEPGNHTEPDDPRNPEVAVEPSDATDTSAALEGTLADNAQVDSAKAGTATSGRAESGDGTPGSAAPDVKPTSRRRALRAAMAAVAVLAVAASAALGSVLSPKLSPTQRWVSDVSPLCTSYLAAVADVAAPMSLTDAAAIASFGSEMTAVHDQFLDRLDHVATTGVRDSAALEFRDAVKRRRDAWKKLAATAEVDPVAEDEIFADVSATFDGSLVGLGAPACARVAVPDELRVPDTLTAQDQLWFTTVEKLCTDTATEMRAADDRAGVQEISRDDYLNVLRTQTRALLEAVDNAGALTQKWAELNRLRWVAAVSDTADALDAGDVDAARAADALWVATAPTSAPSCSNGLAPGTETPSGFVAAPELDAVAVAGFSDGQVTIADQFAANLGVVLVDKSLTGVDPSDNFAIRRVLSQYGFGSGSAGGGEQATPGSPSVSTAARPRDPGRPASPSNPWVTGIAVADTEGSCSAVVMSGFPRLTEYRVLTPREQCSADAAVDLIYPGTS